MLVYYLILFAGIFEAILAENDLKGPLINIPQGKIQGYYKTSYKNRTYSAFEGIPYAQPPIGELRFESPRPAGNWNGTLEANKEYGCIFFMPFPMLYGARGTEDCLYLYVYVPREKINANELLDVIVNIHGGGFMLGSPKYLAGPKYMMDQDVVYVSMNYRLGVMGFMSTEDEVVPGNNGLKDQSLALKWIKENIKYFGGNPNSITITGLSAGGASVHYHYFSPMSKGLFHRGFSQSGTALQCWALSESPLINAIKVAKNLTCPTNSNREMVDCLKKVKDKDLVMAIRSVFVFLDSVPFTPFAPVIEKNSKVPFIDKHPYQSLKDGEVYDVPWITANVKDEGLFPVGILIFLDKVEEFKSRLMELALYTLDLQNTVRKEDQEKVIKEILNFYFKGKEISMENIYTLVKLFSDRMFLVDVEKAVRLHAKHSNSPVYYYLFSYILQTPNLFLVGLNGSTHGDDGKLLYNILGSPDQLPERDFKMMEYFTSFLASYAKTGIPSFAGVKWKPVTEQKNLEYLSIGDPNSIQMKSVARLAPSDFWDSLPIMELAKASSSVSVSSDLVLRACAVILLYLINK